MDVGAALAADRQAPEAGRPSQGSFDDPAVAAEAIGALDAAAGDARRDRPLATFGSAAAVVAGLVGAEPLRAATGSAPAAAHARDDVEHGGQHAAVVPVGPAQLKAERRAAGVDHEVALGARTASVRGVRADLRVRRRAPPFAGMDALSIEARLQSSASAAARRSSSTRCRSPSTPFGATLEPMAGRPSPCQSRSRRQQSLPRTPIRGHARAAEPLPRQHRPGDARAEHEHDALQGRPVVAPVVASCPPALRLRGLVGQQKRHRRPQPITHKRSHGPPTHQRRVLLEPLRTELSGPTGMRGWTPRTRRRTPSELVPGRSGADRAGPADGRLRVLELEWG